MVIYSVIEIIWLLSRLYVWVNVVIYRARMVHFYGLGAVYIQLYNVPFIHIDYIYYIIQIHHI